MNQTQTLIKALREWDEEISYRDQVPKVLDLKTLVFLLLYKLGSRDMDTDPDRQSYLTGAI